MEVVDHLNAVKNGTLSRRAFQKSLLGLGIGMMTTPFAASRAAAQEGQGTLFT